MLVAGIITISMLNQRRRHNHSGDRNAWSCQEKLIRPEVFRSGVRSRLDRDRQREKSHGFAGLVSRARSQGWSRGFGPGNRHYRELCDWPSGISWNGWDGQQNEYPSMTDETATGSQVRLFRACSRRVFPTALGVRSDASFPGTSLTINLAEPLVIFTPIPRFGNWPLTEITDTRATRSLYAMFPRTAHFSLSKGAAPCCCFSKITCAENNGTSRASSSYNLVSLEDRVIRVI